MTLPQAKVSRETARKKTAVEGLSLARMAREVLESKQGDDLVLLDVRGLTSVTDYYLIASGNSVPHLKALAEELKKVLREQGIRCFQSSGTPESAWLVEDYLDVVVHLFTPETRDYYTLEELWNDAKRVD